MSALRAVDGLAQMPDGALGIDGAVPLGLAALDGPLGGGLALGALHEIAARCESEIAAASAFALALAARRPRRAVLWIAQDMALAESGAPYGPGLDDWLAPERLVVVTAAKPRDILWAMEEALACRSVGAVIGEIRNPPRGIDLTATRRLSLAAGRCQGLALLLRSAPGAEASAATTRWIVGAAPAATGSPRLALNLTRNRRGPLGAWIVELNRGERRFDLASAHRESVAQAAVDRPHRASA